ncbi:hypothetical protein GCM10007881_64020 [Mesorhizobium huakuii]|uniref:hypothetical protein n=1 Tax=Mesorhizobium huakuii TaxID=28104 RepID=UPI00235D5580|nr:hypothetical protein [Mesorhizobium huakuii]GLQ82879.1 hypothetical protein GCM10007881_64020 [Mesorhizobium huakuii]
MARKVPEGVALDANGTCQVKSIRPVSSDDGQTVKLDFEDKKGQAFPLVFTENLLADLLFAIGFMSQEMDGKRKASGMESGLHVIRGYGGKDLPPVRVRIGWSPETQKALFVLGNIGLEVPMDADAVLAVGRDLVDKATSRVGRGKASKH